MIKKIELPNYIRIPSDYDNAEFYRIVWDTANAVNQLIDKRNEQDILDCIPDAPSPTSTTSVDLSYAIQVLNEIAGNNWHQQSISHLASLQAAIQLLQRAQKENQ